MQTLTVIPGDGIGPEVMDSALRILKAVRAPFTYDFQEVGDAAFKAIEKSHLAIKGPTGTPSGGGHKSFNVRLRLHFDLYANLRPVIALPGIQALKPNVNLVLVRENTEDLYTGVERMIDEGTPNEAAECIKRITRKGSERIARFAFAKARQLKLKKVAIVHKANIMKMTDGLFLRTCLEVAGSHPEIETRDVIVDNCCMQLVTRPEQFEVLVTENLYGDILSDLCAGLVGGLGVVPGANIGDDCAIFEAVHGSAPDIAGQGKANPTALIQSAILLLEHVGEIEKARAVREALTKALANAETRTRDIGGSGTTESFTQSIIAALPKI